MTTLNFTHLKLECYYKFYSKDAVCCTNLDYNDNKDWIETLVAVGWLDTVATDHFDEASTDLIDIIASTDCIWRLHRYSRSNIEASIVQIWSYYIVFRLSRYWSV